MTLKNRRLFSADHIYRHLTVALGLFFLLGPVLSTVTDSPKLYTYLTTGLLIFALFEITRRATDLMIGLALGVPAVAGGVFNAATPDTPTFNLVPLILGTLFLAFLVWRILKDVIDGSRISSEKIYGAVCAYLLIGFLFANVYGFIALADTNAFALSTELENHLLGSGPSRIHGVLNYFSFVTMSTLGYGDMTPVSQAARTLAWVQAVIGQLYLAVIVAALVGAHIANRNH
ncbi:MAG: ion channel [Thermoanaerobaculales bacterium]|jgi:hypothetical protein|nr:ion channel [Thermoanaerobaculales bacterium]